MPEAKSVSIHETTSGALNSLLELEGCECFQSVKLLTYFAGALLDYVEEGIPLSPPVLLCNSVAAFARVLPGSMVIHLGDDTFRPNLGKSILKRVASLTGNGGIIFIERKSDTDLSYGVLSTLDRPTALSPYEVLDNVDLSGTGFAILLERQDPRHVAFIGAKRNTLIVSFATSKDVQAEGKPVRSFSETCTKEVSLSSDSSGAEPSELRSELTDYLTRCLTRCINSSHGTILICTDAPLSQIDGLQDFVELKPALDLVGAFLTFKRDESADSLLEIQRAESLLTGLMNSDGIVVFNKAGKVTAFRVFYRPSSDTKTPQASPAPGGARRRAFDGVSELVGLSIVSVMFRSQDGACEFKGTSK